MIPPSNNTIKSDLNNGWEDIRVETDLTNKVIMVDLFVPSMYMYAPLAIIPYSKRSVVRASLLYFFNKKFEHLGYWFIEIAVNQIMKSIGGVIDDDDK